MVQVQVSIPVSNAPAKGETLIQSPRWMPGFYMLQDYGKKLVDFTATAQDGKPLAVEAVDDSTWRIRSTGSVSEVNVQYKAPMECDSEVAHYSGAPTYVYVVGRTKEKCSLHVELPKDWNIAIGLDGHGADYHAEGYDELADNPVTMGKFLQETYITDGKPLTIALQGAGAAQIDRKQLAKELAFVSDMESDFMGGAPYHKYIWHLNIYPGRGGGGGLEHLSGTEITTGSELSPGAAGLFAHEHFHLWNVKRIRSSVLGPFDYTKLPKTGALWWLEGVTEYYAQSLLHRYGWTTDEEWYKEAARDIGKQESVPERLTVSPYNSSFRVDEANGGRGNSNGFGISYYDDGFVVGLCLDIEMIVKTNGRRSLDDVEYALWRECRNGKPGFKEDEIRKQLIVAGGPSFGPFYDKVVMSPGELPVAAALAQVGLELKPHTESRPDVGFTSQPSVEKSGVEIIAAKSTEIESVLPKGTVVRSINGHNMAGATGQAIRRSYLAAIAGVAAGAELKLRVLLPAAEAESDVVIKAISVPVTTPLIQPIMAPSAEQLRFRGLWMAKSRRIIREADQEVSATREDRTN